MSIGRTNPFHTDGVWLKCALHTHSTVSDGTLTPRYLAQSYAEAGFDVVSITDHWRLTEVASSDLLLTIPGAELGFDLAHPHYPGQSGEFLVYGLDHLPEDPGGNKDNWQFNDDENWEARTFPSLTVASQWAAAMNAVVYVAHPYWNGLSIDELLSTEGYVGLEVFNASAEVETGRGDSSTWWDVLLGSGRTMFGIGTDDQHYPLFELGGGWTMVHAAERSEEAVIDALRTGQSYFSHGPSILDITPVVGGVEVACSPARSVILHREQEYGVSVSVGANGRRMGRIIESSPDGLITRVFLADDAVTPLYQRLSVVDAQGRRAWSNPF